MRITPRRGGQRGWGSPQKGGNDYLREWEVTRRLEVNCIDTKNTWSYGIYKFKESPGFSGGVETNNYLTSCSVGSVGGPPKNRTYKSFGRKILGLKRTRYSGCVLF